jgi:hypothetical protein
LGNVGRHRRWPLAIVLVLFVLTFVWSFAVMGEEAGSVWRILLIVSAVGAGISALLLVLMFVSSRRLRRAKGDEGSEMGDGQQPVEEPPTEEAAPTYEEVFGLELDPDEASLLRAPEDEEWPGDEGSEMDADGQQPAEEHAPTSEEDVQALDADVDESADQVEALDAGGDSQDNLRRMREEFKARAEEAAFRVKQREAELHEASSAPDAQR